MHTKLLGFISVDFDVKDQLLIRYFVFVRSERTGTEWNILAPGPH